MPHKALLTLCRTPERSTVFYLVTTRFIEVLGCLVVSLSTYTPIKYTACVQFHASDARWNLWNVSQQKGHNKRREIVWVREVELKKGYLVKSFRIRFEEIEQELVLSAVYVKAVAALLCISTILLVCTAICTVIGLSSKNFSLKYLMYRVALYIALFAGTFSCIFALQRTFLSSTARSYRAAHVSHLLLSGDENARSAAMGLRLVIRHGVGLDTFHFRRRIVAYLRQRA